MTEEKLTFALRPLEESDWNCVLKSWLRSYRATRPTWRDYYTQKHHEIEVYRQRGAAFLIACDPADKTTIFGWACVEAPVVHFVYVKPYFRGQGIAKTLVASGLGNSLCVAYTHKTASSEAIARTHDCLRLVTMG